MGEFPVDYPNWIPKLFVRDNFLRDGSEGAVGMRVMIELTKHERLRSVIPAEKGKEDSMCVSSIGAKGGESEKPCTARLNGRFSIMTEQPLPSVV
ncbi:MAG: hypothetical protein HGB15_05605 [Chlorobaculum sp.]|nr:hypothetical protein [Chlorobaculum sp.]